MGEAPTEAAHEQIGTLFLRRLSFLFKTLDPIVLDTGHEDPDHILFLEWDNGQRPLERSPIRDRAHGIRLER